jgi:hypothetical protein
MIKLLPKLKITGCIKNVDVNHTPGRNIGIQRISGYWTKKGSLKENVEDQAVKRSRLLNIHTVFLILKRLIPEIFFIATEQIRYLCLKNRILYFLFAPDVSVRALHCPCWKIITMWQKRTNLKRSLVD